MSHGHSTDGAEDEPLGTARADADVATGLEHDVLVGFETDAAERAVVVGGERATLSILTPVGRKLRSWLVT